MYVSDRSQAAIVAPAGAVLLVGSDERLAALDAFADSPQISVICYHLGRWLRPSWLAPSADLSVDFFFCLSGYVLSFAYGRKKETLSFSSFVGIRLLRLMPLIVIATILSAVYVVVRSIVPGLDSHVAGQEVSALVIATAVVLGILKLPYFGAPQVVGGPQLFPPQRTAAHAVLRVVRELPVVGDTQASPAADRHRRHARVRANRRGHGVWRAGAG